MSKILDFNNVLSHNVNGHTENKNGLTYLSWSWAWAEFVKFYPTATYEIVKNEKGLPYFDDDSGAVVYTKVSVNELTHEMWLPVMDHANYAMKKEPYTVKTKHKEITVSAYSMTNINKAIMRCLTKNLAMFGLGLYIYAGEDLPEKNPDVIADEKAILDAKNKVAKVLALKGIKPKEWVNSEMKGKEVNDIATVNALLKKAEALPDEDDLPIDAGGMTPKDISA